MKNKSKTKHIAKKDTSKQKKFPLLFSLIVILVATYFIYAPVGNFSFLNWDDDKQITDNFIIRDINSSTLPDLFKFDKHTTLSLFTFAIDYKLWGLNAGVFHYTNLFFHLLNILLAFFLAQKLTGNNLTSLLTAAFFALHPMRVESVAWVSERKDLLFTFFFFISMYSYIFYLEKRKIVWFGLALIIGYLSSLSKIQAVALPVVWLLLDILYKRKLSISYVYEKYILVFMMLMFNPFIKIEWLYLLLYLLIYMSIFNFEKYLSSDNEQKARLYALLAVILLFVYKRIYYRYGPETLFILAIFIAFSNKFLFRTYYNNLLIRITELYKKFRLLLIGIAAIALIVLSFYAFHGGYSFWGSQQSPENLFGLSGRLIYASYSLYFYVIKFFLPLSLTAINPYPLVESLSELQPIFFVSFIFNIILAISLVFYFRKVKQNNSLLLFFIFFFLANIFLVLHIIPIEGRLLTADRYSYLAYFGLFALISYFITLLINKNKAYVILPLAILIAITFISRQRVFAWKDSVSLFKDVLEKNEDIAFAWLNLGTAYYDRKDYQNALNAYNSGLQKKASPLDASMLYNSRGWVVFTMDKKNAALAINDFTSAISLNPSNASAFNNRGWVYYKTSKPDSALTDFNRAIELDTNNYLYYNNRGMLLNDLKRYDEAISDLTRCIQINPEYFYGYNNRGWAWMNLGNYPKAIEDFNLAMKGDNKNRTFLINLADAYFLNKEYNKAKIEYKKILGMQPNDEVILYKLILSELYAGDVKEGCMKIDLLRNFNPQITDSLKKSFCNNSL